MGKKMNQFPDDMVFTTILEFLSALPTAGQQPISKEVFIKHHILTVICDNDIAKVITEHTEILPDLFLLILIKLYQSLENSHGDLTAETYIKLKKLQLVLDTLMP